MSSLKVNEMYGPTIQGEGKTVGKEVLFLRLTGCNLYCIWCDTPWTWNWIGTDFKHPAKSAEVDETHEMTAEQIFTRLKELGGDLRSVVISGGEPLTQQKMLLPLLRLLRADGWWIEVETNGTVPPSKGVWEMVDQINCSPKLSSAQIPYDERIKPKTLMALNSSGKTNFKFVIMNNQDAEEMLALHDQFRFRDVYVMAEGRTKEELAAKDLWAREFCGAHGFHYTERLHILKWASKRGV